MPLLKVRSRADLDHYRRAGHQFSPVAQIIDVDTATAAVLEADTASLHVMRATESEAEAYRAAHLKAVGDPESMAAENARLATELAAQGKRIADLEEALRRFVGDEGGFGDEPEPPGGRGVKPSIAPGSKGKPRGET